MKVYYTYFFLYLFFVVRFRFQIFYEEIIVNMSCKALSYNILCNLISTIMASTLTWVRVVVIHSVVRGCVPKILKSLNGSPICILDLIFLHAHVLW